MHAFCTFQRFLFPIVSLLFCIPLCRGWLRFENHRWGSHPVREEDGWRDDPDGVRTCSLRPHRPPALHGELAAEVHPLAPWQRHHLRRLCYHDGLQHHNGIQHNRQYQQHLWFQGLYWQPRYCFLNWGLCCLVFFFVFLPGLPPSSLLILPQKCFVSFRQSVFLRWQLGCPPVWKQLWCWVCVSLVVRYWTCASAQLTVYNSQGCVSQNYS